MQKIFEETKDVYARPHSYTALGAVRPTSGTLRLTAWVGAHFNKEHGVLVVDFSQQLQFDPTTRDDIWRRDFALPEGVAKLPRTHRVLKPVDGLGAAARVTVAIVDEYYATAKHWAETTYDKIQIVETRAL